MVMIPDIDPVQLWSSGKSPAADPIIAVLRSIEIDLAKDFTAARAQWMKEAASAKAHRDIWLACIAGRWIIDNKPTIINAKKLRREAGLPGLREAEKVKLALDALVEADWLAPAPERAGGGPGPKRDDYVVKPRLRSLKNG
jgi:hypothetical protein